MRPLVETKEDVARLREIARSWCDTPYTPDGAVKGHGVSCHQLPSAILQEFGFKGPEAPAKQGLLKSQIAQAMVDFLNAHPEYFEKVEGDPMAGDVIVSVFGYGHLVLALDNGDACHAWQRQGAHIASMSGDKVDSRKIGIWRPLKHET